MRWTTLLLLVLSACEQSTPPVAGQPEPNIVTWTRSEIAPASITTLPTVIAEVNGGGLAVEDVDGDGDEDLLVATPGTMNTSGTLRLYRNQGRGQFLADPAMGFEGVQGWLTGLATADFDQDGHLDVVVGRLGTDLFLRGTPEGFSPPTELPGLGWTTSMAAADLDGDGDCDLLRVRYLEFDPIAPPPPATYKGIEVLGGPHGLTAEGDDILWNEPAGFRSEPLSGSPSYGLNAQVLDLNGDGQLDVLVGNDSQGNHAYLRQDDGWVERGAAIGLAGNGDGMGQATMGMAASDFNGDGQPDLFSTNFSADTNTFLESVGDGFFADRTAVRGLGVNSRPLLGWSAQFGDVDLDGDEDLLFVNGHVYPQATPNTMGSAWAQPAVLMLRSFNRFVRDETFPSPDEQGRLAVLFDADGDHDLDVVTVTRDGAVNLTTAATPSKRGQGCTMRFPDILRGRRVQITSGETTQVRWIPSGGGFQSSSPPVVHARVPSGSVVVQVDGLPAQTYEVASDPRSRSVIWDTSSTTKSTP